MQEVSRRGRGAWELPTDHYLPVKRVLIVLVQVVVILHVCVLPRQGRRLGLRCGPVLN